MLADMYANTHVGYNLWNMTYDMHTFSPICYQTQASLSAEVTTDQLYGIHLFSSNITPCV